MGGAILVLIKDPQTKKTTDFSLTVGKRYTQSQFLRAEKLWVLHPPKISHVAPEKSWLKDYFPGLSFWNGPFFRGELLHFGGIAPMIFFHQQNLRFDVVLAISKSQLLGLQWKGRSRCFWIWKFHKISTHLFDIKISRFILEFRKKTPKTKHLAKI